MSDNAQTLALVYWGEERVRANDDWRIGAKIAIRGRLVVEVRAVLLMIERIIVLTLVM